MATGITSPMMDNFTTIRCWGSQKKKTNLGLKTLLENLLINSSNPADRKRAFDMLKVMDGNIENENSNKTKLLEYRIKGEIRRPITANPKFNGDYAKLQRFSTTYKEHYPVKPLKETIAERPSSTMNLIAKPNNRQENMLEATDHRKMKQNNFPNDIKWKNLSDYSGVSEYTVSYDSSSNSTNLVNPRQNPDRCATASGARCHNPHPKPEFLVWRIPRSNSNNLINSSDNKEGLKSDNLKIRQQLADSIPLKVEMDSNLAQITDEQFDRVMRGNSTSVYKSDYRGSAVNDAANAYKPYYLQPEISRGEHLKQSTQRIDFDRPKTQGSELRVPVNRYGSNTKKLVASCGIIPGAVNKVYLHSNTRTTYDEDVNDRAKVIHGKIVDDIQRKIDLSKIHNLKDIERAIVEATNSSDKEQLERVLEKLNEPENYKRKSFVRKPFYHSTSSLAWSSKWAGPLSY